MEDEAVVEPPSDMLETKQSRTCTDITTESPLTTSSDDISQLFHAVIALVKRDLVASDVKWSLFVAANHRVRHDSCLRPFPPMFIKEGNKDFVGLNQAIEAVPGFEQLQLESAVSLPQSAVRLLHWVLLELRDPSLSTVDRSQVDKVLSLVSCDLEAPRPGMVVKVSHDPSSASERKWSAVEQEYGSLYVFHGSRVENFHSILHHGLQQHLTKNALFGQGVYLSSELLVCLPYSRTGTVWSHSRLGTHCSIVALCQIVNHPTVLCQDEGNMEKKTRAMAKDSLAGEVPHKLYVVPNSDLIRIRYLLIYTASNSPAPQRIQQRPSGLFFWLNQHKMVASMIAYAVLLASIGLSRSPTFLRLWRQFCHLIGIYQPH